MPHAFKFFARRYLPPGLLFHMDIDMWRSFAEELCRGAMKRSYEEEL
jgi:hypothetical protein